jgi:hypothetical protein
MHAASRSHPNFRKSQILANSAMFFGTMHDMQTLANNPILRFAAALGLAVIIGSLAFFLQQQGVVPAFFYPLLFPLLVGGLSGALVGLLVSPNNVRAKNWPLAMLALAAGLIVFTVETFWAYRTYVAAAKATLEQNPLGQMVQAANADAFKPASPWRFMHIQFERSGGWWLIDGLLVCVATVIAAIVVSSQMSRPSASEHDGDTP